MRLAGAPRIDLLQRDDVGLRAAARGRRRGRGRSVGCGRRAPWMFQVMTRIVWRRRAHARPPGATEACAATASPIQRGGAQDQHHDIPGAGFGQDPDDAVAHERQQHQAGHHADQRADHEVDEADAAGADRQVDHGEGRDRHHAQRHDREQAALAQAFAGRAASARRACGRAPRGRAGADQVDDKTAAHRAGAAIEDAEPRSEHRRRRQDQHGDGKTMAPASTNTRRTSSDAQGSPRTAVRTARTLSAVDQRRERREAPRQGEAEQTRTRRARSAAAAARASRWRAEAAPAGSDAADRRSAR